MDKKTQVVKMLIFPKLIHVFNTILSKTPKGVFYETGWADSTVYTKTESARNNQDSPKEQLGRITCLIDITLFTKLS